MLSSDRADDLSAHKQWSVSCKQLGTSPCDACSKRRRHLERSHATQPRLAYSVSPRAAVFCPQLAESTFRCVSGRSNRAVARKQVCFASSNTPNPPLPQKTIDVWKQKPKTTRKSSAKSFAVCLWIIQRQRIIEVKSDQKRDLAELELARRLMACNSFQFSSVAHYWCEDDHTYVLRSGERHLHVPGCSWKHRVRSAKQNIFEILYRALNVFWTA